MLPGSTFALKLAGKRQPPFSKEVYIYVLNKFVLHKKEPKTYLERLPSCWVIQGEKRKKFISAWKFASAALSLLIGPGWANQCLPFI